MNHKIEEDLRIICREILEEKKSLVQWAEIESDDMFQRGNYLGGFDATEKEFCFSLFLDNNEYWFQFSLYDAEEITKNKINFINVYVPD